MSDILEYTTFSANARHAIRIARAFAKENMSPSVHPAHLVKALMHPSSGLLEIVECIQADRYYIEEWADVRIEALPRSSALPEIIPIDNIVQATIREADILREELGKPALESLHIIAALCTAGIAFSYEQLRSFPVKREEWLEMELPKVDIQTLMIPTKAAGKSGTGKPDNSIDQFCIDKMQGLATGERKNIVGRDKEIRMMTEILCRHMKPNVLFVGEPGVGKTSIVDAFALAIHNGQVPVLLKDARLFELNTSALIAGASYKGEIEDRFRTVLTGIKKLPKAILFIDDLHQLFDKNGSLSGVLKILKAGLTTNDLTVVAATNVEEHHKMTLADEAICRRFETLMVDEPLLNACFHMIKARIPDYQQHHHILVPDETIRAMIEMSKRYSKERKLPDSALDIVDRTMAALRLINDRGEAEIQDCMRIVNEKTSRSDATPEEDLADWNWLLNEMKDKVSSILWNHVEGEEKPLAENNPTQIQVYLQNTFKQMQVIVSSPIVNVTTPDVAAIISLKTGIPVGKIQTRERQRLMQMEPTLKTRVVGQDHAIRTICEAVLESRSGLTKSNQPIGSFFFLGPTGTGKTELTKALAEYLFEDESSMIRFDMSEFKEEHAAAVLYGAPPGYVGYEEGGLLVNKIRQKPYSVVLFDEIEKAHPSVFDLFLQIMDEGKLHDKLGKTGDFSNALVIFTSNIGSEFIESSFSTDSVPSSDKLLQIMADFFRPEFLGRLTEIIPFSPINPDMIKRILQIQLKSLIRLLEKKGISFSLSSAAEMMLSQKGFSTRYGARPLNGVIRSALRRPLSRMIINGEIEKGSSVYVDVNENDDLIFNCTHNTNQSAF